MEYIISGLAILIAIIALSYQIRDYQRKNKYTKFKGRIGKDENDGKETGEFVKFIFKSEGRIVYLDIYFDNEEDYEVDKEGVFAFSIYYDYKNKLNGGYAFRIEVSKKDDFFFDKRPSSKRLLGNFKIIGATGPQQGWFTAILKPVKIESI